MIIYVVIGESGEYSDRTLWLAKAFQTKPDANRYVIEVEKTAQEMWKQYDKKRDEVCKLIKKLHFTLRNNDGSQERDLLKSLRTFMEDLENPYDPKMKLQSNGESPSYYIEEVEVIGETL